MKKLSNAEAELKKTQRTQTSLRRLQDVLKRSRHDVLQPNKMSSQRLERRRIYDVLKTSNLRRLEDV